MVMVLLAASRLMKNTVIFASADFYLCFYDVL